MVSARLRLVLIIRIRLPIIKSGARVPMRSETWVKRWRVLASLGEADHHCPASFARSAVAIGKGLYLEESASRRSSATLSPTCTESVVADGDQRAYCEISEHQQRGLDDDGLVVFAMPGQ